MTFSWPELTGALLAGHDLTAEQTQWAMAQVMADAADPVAVAGLIVALRAKGETAEEVSGFVNAMLDAALALPVSGPTLDIVGTGGDMAQTVNISTMSAIVSAAAGARVVKHGNRAASSKCGSADVLVALGVKADLGPEGVARCVDEVGIGFAFAPVFHPAMRFVAPVRSALGVPTVFNILGPLANPARPSAQMVGCADRRLAPVMAGVLAERGTRALVVRGDDGLDEITIFANTEVWDSTGGSVRNDHIDVSRTGVSAAGAQDLRGGTAELNAEIAADVFAGNRTGALAAVRDAVVLNAAAGLLAWDCANGQQLDGDLTERLVAAMPRAAEAIDSGAATRLLDQWRLVSHDDA